MKIAIFLSLIILWLYFIPLFFTLLECLISKKMFKQKSIYEIIAFFFFAFKKKFLGRKLIIKKKKKPLAKKNTIEK